jgi:hypothetical protein
VLRAEFERASASPIVLNRGLREAVQRMVDRGELTLSEIAMRCGRMKRDRQGNSCRETSWLARAASVGYPGGEAPSDAMDS